MFHGEKNPTSCKEIADDRAHAINKSCHVYLAEVRNASRPTNQVYGSTGFLSTAKMQRAKNEIFVLGGCAHWERGKGLSDPGRRAGSSGSRHVGADETGSQYVKNDSTKGRRRHERPKIELCSSIGGNDRTP